MFGGEGYSAVKRRRMGEGARCKPPHPFFLRQRCGSPLPQRGEGTFSRAESAARSSRRLGERACLGAGGDGEGGPRVDGGLPAFKLGKARPLDGKVEAALDNGSERNLGKRQAAEGKPLLSSKMAVENFQRRNEIGGLRGIIGRALAGGFLH